jgi:outer membrane protein
MHSQHKNRTSLGLIQYVSPLLFVSAALAHAWGEDAVVEQLHLILDRAVALALQQNIQVQIASINIAMKQQEKTMARSELLPHASLGLDDVVSRFNLKARFGEQIPGVPKNIGAFNALTVGPSFYVPVFDLSLVRRLQASGWRLKATSEDGETVREETVLLTVDHYLAHLRALASVAAAQSRVKLAGELLRQANDLRQDGVSSKIDVSRAEVRLREEKQTLIDAQSEMQTTQFSLKQLLNLEDSQSLAFDDADHFFETPPLEIANPIAKALAQRPELKALSASAEAAESERKAAVATSLPTIKFDGAWNEQGQTFTTIYPGYDYHVGFEIPLFTGGRLKAERADAVLAEQKTNRLLADARNQVVEETRDGEVELNAARSQTDLAQQQVALANEEIELAKGRFQAGVTDNIEVVVAQDELARANDAQIGALYRYNIARARLARAVGDITQTYSH